MNEPYDPDLAAMQGPRVPGPVEYVGLGAGLVPFAAHYTQSSSSSVNGVTTSATFIDYVAVGGGGLALLVGLLALGLSARTPSPLKQRRLAIAGGIVLLGVFQLARGFGVLHV